MRTASKPKDFAKARMASRSGPRFMFKRAIWVAVAASLISGKAARIVREAAFGDGGTQLAHNLLVESDVVPGEQHQTQHLLAAEKMVEIGPAVDPAGVAGNGFIEGARVVGVPRIAQIER